MVKKLTLIAHRIVVTLGAVVWGIGNLWYVLAICCALLGDWLVPNATAGNCWSYAFPLWYRRGGYLLVRPADGNRFLAIFPVPHVIWVKSLPRRGMEAEQFVPTNRKMAKWWPWHTVYYEGSVREVEAPHPAKPKP